MPRQRTILLVSILGLFALLTTLLIAQRISYSKNHYQLGQVPADLANNLIPKTVPLSSLHPPALRTTDPIRYGGVTSTISVIEYGDFQCEYCRQMTDQLKQAIAPYHGKVRLVWRDLPIEDQHADALDAAVFARCAGQQGMFWQAYDALMIGSLGESAYSSIAANLRLDTQKLDACRRDPNVAAAIHEDVAESRADGISGAPLLFIGTQAIDGYADMANIKSAIDNRLSSL